jgi:hypothetical protein
MKLHDELGRPHMDNPGGAVIACFYLSLGKSRHSTPDNLRIPLHGKIMRTPLVEGGLK